MIRVWTLAVFLMTAFAAACQAGVTPPSGLQWIVVVAPGLRAALSPLIDHRTKEGLKVVVVTTDQIPGPDSAGGSSALQAHVEALCRDHHGPSSVLLVGAYAAMDAPATARAVVPPLVGTVGRMAGQPTDHGYGGPGAEGRPAVAVGRFPARTAGEAAGMVAKTLRLENDGKPGEWRNRLTLLVGNPGGGSLGEMMVETATQPRLARLHPSWELRAAFHSEGSRFYVPSADLRETTKRFLEEGQLFSVYLGHSHAASLSSGNISFWDRADWLRLRPPHPQGVFFTCGCYACQVRGTDEGYGLTAIRNPDGPAAVIGAFGESYAAPGLLALDGLIGCCAAPPFPERLGDYWLAVQEGLAAGDIPAALFSMCDALDGSGGKVPLALQRREHLEMWTLLGDPALRLPIVARDIELSATGLVSARCRLEVSGALPGRLSMATVRVTLERGTATAPAQSEKLPPPTAETAQERSRIAKANLRRANEYVLASVEAKREGRRFRCDLELPTVLPWSNVVVRAWATTSDASGLGVLSLPVRP